MLQIMVQIPSSRTEAHIPKSRGSFGGHTLKSSSPTPAPARGEQGQAASSDRRRRANPSPLFPPIPGLLSKVFPEPEVPLESAKATGTYRSQEKADRT